MCRTKNRKQLPRQMQVISKMAKRASDRTITGFEKIPRIETAKYCQTSLQFERSVPYYLEYYQCTFK